MKSERNYSSHKEPRVFIPQEATSEKDLSSAMRYGVVVPIIGVYERPANNTRHTMAKLYEALESFDPENDFICLAGGDPIMGLLTGVVLERLGIESFKQLYWTRERDDDGNRLSVGTYLPRSVSIYNNEE